MARAGELGAAAARTVGKDASFWSIAGANLFTLAVALAQKWPLSEIMWIYWWQSVIIGGTNFVRMWTLKEFSTAGLTSNGRPVSETQAGARSTATFFAFHFGIFHFVYMIFLFALPMEEGARAMTALDATLASLAVLAFLASHVFSLRYNSGRDFRSRRPNLGTLMFYPYLRIIPMHLTIIVGAALGGAGIYIFMALKTVADVATHAVEHHLFRRG